MAKGSVSFFIQQHLEHLEPFRFELFSYFTTSSIYHILYSVRHVVNANGLLIDSIALKTFCFQPLQVSTPPAAHLHFCRQMMKNLIFVVTFVSVEDVVHLIVTGFLGTSSFWCPFVTFCECYFCISIVCPLLCLQLKSAFETVSEQNAGNKSALMAAQRKDEKSAEMISELTAVSNDKYELKQLLNKVQNVENDP